MNANEFGKSFGITNPNDNRAAYIEAGYKMAERNYKTAASRRSFMAGYMEYAPAAQGRCGTCGELKPVQNFTDGECNDCHFVVIEEAPETTPEPDRPEGYDIVEASQANARGFSTETWNGDLTMAKQQFDPERDLRAWADALNSEIWMYTLRAGCVNLSIPNNAELLRVVKNGTNAELLVKVHPGNPHKTRTFIVVKIGELFNSEWLHYIDSVSLGDVIYNVFEYKSCFPYPGDKEIFIEHNREIERQIEEIYGLQTASDMASAQDDFMASGFFTKEANAIQDKLEEQGITLVEETEYPDTVHVLKNSQPWLVFNISDWEWTLAEGTH